MAGTFFLSVVTLVHNRASELPDLVAKLEAAARVHSDEYEIILVDNASSDDSIDVLQGLTSESGTPNLQVYALSLPVDVDTAQFVGLENALGDFVAIVDLDQDDLEILPRMIASARSGKDIVIAANTRRTRTSLVYRIASSVFHRLYRSVYGVHLREDAPRYRILSRKVINHILRHDSPNFVYRRIPAAAGFPKERIAYESSFEPVVRKGLIESLEISIRQLVSTGAVPLRLLSSLCIFGATANVGYSIYVFCVFLFKRDIAPGWVTLSLQQSGMFFLMSLVLLLLGEYVLHITTATKSAPLYLIAQEMTSHIVTRRNKINVDEALDPRVRESPDGEQIGTKAE